MKKTLKVLGFLILFVLIVALAGGTYINLALPNTGKPLSINIERTPERLKRGEYLANHVAACMDCHSSRDWSLYSGPMKPGTMGMGGEIFDENTGMPGKIYSANITPHSLGSWTDGEILRAITTGVNKDGKALFSLMGYSRFGKMDKEDIYSIIAYVRSLKPIKNDVPETNLNFPVNLINKTLPEPANFQTIPNEKDTVKYGAYIANAAGCVDCHSTREKGNIVAGSEFGGGMEFIQPSGTLSSPNITMHKQNGIGSWTKEAFVQRFKLYTDSTYKPQQMDKSELNTPMPWTMYAGMNTKDIESIYVYLKSLKPNANKIEIRSNKN